MIEHYSPAIAGNGAQLLLRPRRALTVHQFVGVFGLITLATLAVAVYGFTQGNVFAPVFALIDIVFVAVALRWVWRSGDRFELIAIDERRLEVRRHLDGDPDFTAHPYWVRLDVAQAGEQTLHVRLGAQGHEVEVGSFLSADERQQLASQLKIMLGRVMHPVQL